MRYKIEDFQSYINLITTDKNIIETYVELLNKFLIDKQFFCTEEEYNKLYSEYSDRLNKYLCIPNYILRNCWKEVFGDTDYIGLSLILFLFKDGEYAGSTYYKYGYTLANYRIVVYLESVILQNNISEVISELFTTVLIQMQDRYPEYSVDPIGRLAYLLAGGVLW